MHSEHLVRNGGALALSAVLLTGAFAQKTSISDAEVQSNLLKAFAADTRLVNDPITTSTAFGNVTLTGAVATEAERDAADQIASRVEGVRKVVDQLRVGDAAVADARTQANTSAAQGAAQAQSGTQPSTSAAQGAAQAQSGTQPQSETQAQSAQGGGAPSAQAQIPVASPETSDADLERQQYGIGAPAVGTGAQTTPSTTAQAGPNETQPVQGYPRNDQGNQGYPPTSQPYPQATQGYPQADQNDPQVGAANTSQGGYQNYPQSSPQGYPPPPPGRLYRRDYERQMAERNGAPAYPYAANGYGQPGGARVVVPNGIVLTIRINRWLASGDAQQGSVFDAVVANDIVTAGQIAIPRGATVQGSVVDATGAGALKGRGSLTLQLTSLILGGQIFPLLSEPFTINGRDKTGQSVGSTIAGGAIGAIIGGAVGGGAGAAIGAGVGGVAGLGASAASNGGQAVAPSEALLRFRLNRPVEVTTVSEAELQRLGSYAGPIVGGGPRPGSYGYARPYPNPYGPGYYRGGYPY